MFSNGNYQVNGYNENDVHRLSSTVEGEDPIAQAMGLQPQQPQQTRQIEYRNDVVYNTQRQPQPIQQINANGKTISISISPDGTITITLN
jgi:hypothetical protein